VEGKKKDGTETAFITKTAQTEREQKGIRKKKRPRRTGAKGKEGMERVAPGKL